MIIPTLNHHSKCNSLTQRQHRRFILRCTLLCLLIMIIPNLHAKSKSLNIAIFDTGFCPNLLPSSKRISIAPPKDFTQSNEYLCQKEQLSSFRFHGQWILKYLVTHFHPKEAIKLNIYPYIVFNKNGDQKRSYWELALKQMKQDKIDLSLMAVGLPVPIKSKALKVLTALANQSQSSLFVAAGQKDVRITDKVQLFPQNAKNRLLAILLGNFYPPLAPSEKGLIPPALLNISSIDYFIKNGHYDQLRDTSLSVVQGLTIALNDCSLRQVKTHLKLRSCLKHLSRPLKIKFENSIISVKSLSL